MEKTSFADWYPFLKPLYSRAPSWASGFLKEAAELKEMETNLWMQLIGEAQETLDQSKMRPSKYSYMCKNSHLRHVKALHEISS